MSYANNKGTDQPAQSLISAFVFRCLDSIILIPLLVIAEISRSSVVSVAEKADLSLNWLQTPKTGFLVTWFIYSNIL